MQTITFAILYLLGENVPLAAALNPHVYVIYKGNRLSLYEVTKKTTGFWCNYYKLAETVDPENIWIANIETYNPVIVDCRFLMYGNMTVDSVDIYPEKAKKSFLHFISQKAPGCHSFGTDDFASFLNDCKEYDVVILKNIREGLYPKYPIYDVIVLNEKLIKNKKKIDLGSSLYIKEYSTKRIDLSKYIHENEQDGLAEILEYPGYSIKIILDPENSVCKTILHINGRGTGSYINIKLEGTVYKLTDDPYLGEVLNPISGETCISIESDKDIDISSFDFNPGQLQVVFFTKD